MVMGACEQAGHAGVTRETLGFLPQMQLGARCSGWARCGAGRISSAWLWLVLLCRGTAGAKPHQTSFTNPGWQTALPFCVWQ